MSEPTQHTPLFELCAELIRLEDDPAFLSADTHADVAAYRASLEEQMRVALGTSDANSEKWEMATYELKSAINLAHHQPTLTAALEYLDEVAARHGNPRDIYAITMEQLNYWKVETRRCRK